MSENIFMKPGLATGQLPSVSADDNDKVLTVVNGKWDKAESGGGSSGGGVINAEIKGESGSEYIEVSYNDCLNNYVRLLLSDSNERFVMNAIRYIEEDGMYGVVFADPTGATDPIVFASDSASGNLGLYTQS